MRRQVNWILCLLLAVCIMTAGCGNVSTVPVVTAAPAETETPAEVENTEAPEETISTEKEMRSGLDYVSVEEIPDYSGFDYCIINNDVPFFDDADLKTDVFEYYSKLDSLGRCRFAYANLGRELMPTEPIGSIAEIKPSGWHTVRYDDIIEDRYLYNRCHLIGYQLTGEGANELNLITGTRYFNISGMLPLENLISQYIYHTNNHVLYRVTPFFEGNNLVAKGVLMESSSIEDNGAGIKFCRFVYNIQPGVVIDYSTGESSRKLQFVIASDAAEFDGLRGPADTEPAPTEQNGEEAITEMYVLNINSKKFHRPDCSGASDMKEKNKIEYEGSRDEAIQMGYDPCRMCMP